MYKNCKLCPCPDICLRTEKFCEWAKLENDVYKRHICNSSSRSRENEIIIHATSNQAQVIQNQSTPIIGQGGSLHKIPLALSLEITKEMKECPHFVKCSTGCGLPTCKAGRKGSVDLSKNDGSTLVTFLDCATCLRPDNEELGKIISGL